MSKLFTNIGHTATAKVLLMVIQFATSTILARNLSADDYGVLSFANIMMALLIRLNSMGLSNAVIRTPDLDDKTIRTASSLNLIFSIGAFTVAQIAAPLVGHLLGSPASVNVVRVLAFSFLLAPIGFLPICMLTREMSFGKLKMPGVVGTAVRGFVSISLALSGGNYWSVVAGNLAGSVTNNGILSRQHRAKFRWGVDREKARNLLRFGIPATLSGLITFTLYNADNFVIGSALGSGMLGYYSLAFTWATFGSTGLYEVVHSVLFAQFSRIQKDAEQTRILYRRTLQIIAFSAVGFNVVLLVVADGFLIHVLGRGTDRWLPALEVFKILCVYGAIRACTEPIANPILALGQSKLILKATLFATDIEISLLPYIVGAYGISGAAVLIAFSYLCQWIVYFPFIRRDLHLGFRKVLRIFFPAMTAALVTVLVFELNPAERHDHPFSYIVRAVVSLVLFVGIHELLAEGLVFRELNQIKSRFRR